MNDFEWNINIQKRRKAIGYERARRPMITRRAEVVSETYKAKRQVQVTDMTIQQGKYNGAEHTVKAEEGCVITDNGKTTDL